MKRTPAGRAPALWALAGAWCMGAACAADPGDGPKSALQEEAGLEESNGSGSGAGSTSTTSSGSSTGGGSGTTSSSGSSSSGVEMDVFVPDVEADGISCLLNIPASCPNCATQNASDMPACQKYIQCFIANDCDPTGACASNDGVCGVNTVGGGDAPLMAAVATYSCACDGQGITAPGKPAAD